jgi:hypothetical protein
MEFALKVGAKFVWCGKEFTIQKLSPQIEATTPSMPGYRGKWIGIDFANLVEKGVVTVK